MNYNTLPVEIVKQVMDERTDDQRGVKSAERTLDLLELLASSATPLSFTAITQQLQLPKSSAYGLLGTLERRGYVRLGVEGYQLGPQVAAVGLRYSGTASLLEAAESILTGLGRATDETVHLALLDNTDVIFLRIIESSQPFRLTSAVGRRQDAHISSVGKAQLATLTDQEVRRRYADKPLRAVTRYTHTDVAALLADLAITRTRGYAFDDQESHLGVQCVAAAVHGASNQLTAGISISAPMVRMQRERLAPLVMEAADTLTRRMRTPIRS